MKASLVALLRFLVYSNLFIAVCAVLMVIQTCQLVIHVPPEPHFISFVFFSTVCSYSFHWYLSTPSVLSSPRIEWQHRFHQMHLAFFIIGLAGALISFYFIRQHWLWLSFTAIITFLYSAPKIPHPYFRALRKVALGKTIFLALVWMYVTTMLPVIVSDEPWPPGFYLFIVSRFFLVYAICILFDYRDRGDDKLNGIRSLITWLNEKGIRNLFVFSIAVFATATLGLLAYGFTRIEVLLLLLPGVFVSALYSHAKKNFGDMLYYFVLDGLMALSALLTLLMRI